MLGDPGLAERACSDLAERAIYYLERTLTYIPPGSRVLELGCAPGSFGYLLNEVGMKVTGLEMSDHAAEFVHRTFGLEVFRGPLEKSRLRRKFDAIVLIDVLEHLPRPLETLQTCVDRLESGGILLIQTPCYRGEGTDWPMLLPADHLFLYTAESIRTLVETVGMTVIEVDDSLFPHDMWVVASLRSSLPVRADPLEGLAHLPAAMIRMLNRITGLTDQLIAADRDRAAKGELIARMSDELREIGADQRDKEALIVKLTGELDAARADQDDKEALIDRITEELAAARTDQDKKEALIASITEELAAARIDQDNKEALIAGITEELAAARADQEDKEALIASITEDLETLRADQRDKEALILRISEELEAVRADQRAKEELIEKLSEGQSRR